MTTATLTLTDFLLARIAEDEAVAKATRVTVFDVKWGGAIVAGYGSDMDGEHVGDVVDQTLADHIARHGPARVLAECEAKRRIVERYGWAHDILNAHEYKTLTDLAAVYADHPDYRTGWRP